MDTCKPGTITFTTEPIPSVVQVVELVESFSTRRQRTWYSFINNIKVSFIYMNIDVYDASVDMLIEEIRTIGLSKSPIYYYDKPYVYHYEWTEREDIICTGIKQIARKYLEDMYRYVCSHPGWDDDQKFTMDYMNVIARFTVQVPEYILEKLYTSIKTK